MIKEKKSQRQVDMESPEFQNMVQLCYSWFKDSMKFTNLDEIYDRIYSNYISIKYYQERKLWLKSSIFRLLCGNASLSGQSQTVIIQLHKIKI